MPLNQCVVFAERTLSVTICDESLTYVTVAKKIVGTSTSTQPAARIARRGPGLSTNLWK